MIQSGSGAASQGCRDDRALQIVTTAGQALRLRLSWIETERIDQPAAAQR